MSELNSAGIRATLGAGALILNDYQLKIEDIEGGHRLTATKGSETQAMDVRDGKPGGVQTVNGIAPDNAGNVEIDVGVKTVNGIAPDAQGDVEVEATPDILWTNSDYTAGIDSSNGTVIQPAHPISDYKFCELMFARSTSDANIIASAKVMPDSTALHCPFSTIEINQTNGVAKMSCYDTSATVRQGVITVWYVQKYVFTIGEAGVYSFTNMDEMIPFCLIGYK